MPRITIGLTLLLLAAAVAYFGALPQWQSIVAARAEIAGLQQLSTELGGVIAQRDAIRQVYNAIPEADLQKLAVLAPASPETPAILVDIEALARQHGIALGEVDFTSPEKPAIGGLPVVTGERFANISTNIHLAGSYESFRSFLGGLERNLRLFDASEINFAAGKDVRLPIVLKGDFYYRR